MISSSVMNRAWAGVATPSSGELKAVFRRVVLLGLAVHVVMLLWMLTLPQPIAIDVFTKISLPVMLIYPAVTAVLGKMMANRELRKRTEKKLREGEEKFRLIAEASADDIWQLDRYGQVTYASRAVQDIFGYTICLRLTKGIWPSGWKTPRRRSSGTPP